MAAAYDAVLIGAGHNGLVAAAYLAKAGLRVLVLERRSVVGGGLATQEIHPGFRCDIGAHRIAPLRREMVRDLKLRKHGLNVVRPDPAIFAPTPGGGGLLLSPDVRKSTKAIAVFSGADAERWPEFAERMAGVARFLRRLGALTPPHAARPDRSDLWGLVRLGARLRLAGRRTMTDVLRTLPMPVAELLDEWFETDLLKGALGAAAVTGMSLGPRAAGTACALLLHQAGADGDAPTAVRRVRGGAAALAEALGAAAVEAGAELRTHAGVERIEIRDGRAVGVVLADGEEIAADRVLSGADPRRTFLELVEPTHLTPDFLDDVAAIRLRGACAKLHLALGELPRFDGLPNDGPFEGVISIAPSLDHLEHASDDAKYGAISEEPYLEAAIPSASDPSLAPEGRHVMSILLQYAPYHLKQGRWDDARRDALADRAVATLARYAPNLPDAVIARHVLAPPDLESEFGMSEGNIYHGELTLDQFFLMRPVPGWARYRTPIENLYLCGAGTHPGGGASGSSGYNAAREVLSDLKARKRS